MSTRSSRGPRDTSRSPDPPGARPPPVQEVSPARGAGLGTFGGVFTPSILTILGVIMYLRFGWVVGQVGLVGDAAHRHALDVDHPAHGPVDLRHRHGPAGPGGRRLLHDQPVAGDRDGRRRRASRCSSRRRCRWRCTRWVSRSRVTERLSRPADAGRWDWSRPSLVALLALSSARVAIRAQYFIMARHRPVAAVARCSGTRSGPPDAVVVPLSEVPKRGVLGRLRRVLPGRHGDHGRREHVRRPEAPGPLHPARDASRPSASAT